MKKLGVIGFSEGNGHPYSWSAIFNGFEYEFLKDCGFPVIPNYLLAEKWPESQIEGVRVSHIWCPNMLQAHHIARSCRIPEVVSDFRDFIGKVDGVLLARDDAEKHYEFAAVFIECGLPIYIDKPFALNLADAFRLKSLERWHGQIFTGSAYRYATPLQVTAEDLDAIGTLKHVEVSVPKCWDRYIVHGIEPLLYGIGLQGEVKWQQQINSESYHELKIQWASGVTADLRSYGKLHSPIFFKLYGSAATKSYVLGGSFQPFREALQRFANGIVKSQFEAVDWNIVFHVTEIIERGRKK